MNKLQEIVWNDETQGFVRKDNPRPLRVAVPVGPLCKAIASELAGPDYEIRNAAQKYRSLRPNAFERIQTASDVRPQEFTLPEDAYAFRLYRIS
ncbi:hypothetical protein HY489_05410 [Candidatus Woesearchaeota archaeon]|nr:hypothetical protein [Candidatus Woesearchaeota archaeon]